jgi:hypothetical protein
MSAILLPRHDVLWESSRLAGRWNDSAQSRVLDWFLLMCLGAGAALVSQFVDFHIKAPGHAILRAVLPMACGLALVPRHGAGFVMGLSAFAAAVAIKYSPAGSGTGMSYGAITSLAATGPLLDLAMRRVRSGARLYLAFAIAGLSANALALAVRGTAKGLGLDHGGGKPLALWLPTAAVSYAICGVLAGLISGAIWFRGSNGSKLTADDAETP